MPVKVNWLQLLREKCLEDNAEILTINLRNINEFDKINREMRCQFLCHCGEKGDKTIRGIVEKKTGLFCHKCSTKNRIKKQMVTTFKKYGVYHNSQSEKIKQQKKETCLKNFGVEYSLQSDRVKEKGKKTNLEKYGFENASQSREVKDKIKSTNLERYGVPYSLQCEEIKKKAIETTKIKFGVENVFQSEQIKNKIKATNVEKYGVEYASQNKDVRNKIKATNLEKYGHEFPGQVEKFKEKSKNTCLKIYGVPYSLQSECVKEKGKKTNLERYGVPYSLQSECVKEKGKKTNLQKYGVEYASQNNQFKEKVKNTFIKHYGVEHPMQNKDFFDTHQKLSFKRKDYIFKTGEIDICQGYEHWSLRELEEYCGYKYEDYQNWNGLEFWYEYLNKKRRYYPDIPFLRKNLIIEVKSDYTFYNQIKRNLLKAKSVIEKGINFEFWIYENNRNKNILSYNIIRSKFKINNEIKNQTQ